MIYNIKYPYLELCLSFGRRVTKTSVIGRSIGTYSVENPIPPFAFHFTVYRILIKLLTFNITRKNIFYFFSLERDHKKT